MNLFDKIPENLFSILASKNKGIYIDALFVVKESFKYELNVTRSDLNALLISKLEDEIYEIDPTEDEDAFVKNSDLSAKANYIIRKLLETKWLRAEFRGADFENIIELPDYSKQILDTLEAILTEKTTEYNGLVVSTYNNLTAADRAPEEYAFQALGRALSDTKMLIELLKSLYQNIGRYHQLAIEMTDVNEILKSHFDDFQETVVSKFLHPFKTFDSVPRFKGPILNILNKWYSDEAMLDILSKQALAYKTVKTTEEAHELVVSMISEIMSCFDSLPEIMHEIDMRHNAYTGASIEKIQYLLNRDQSVKGNLVTLIKGLKAENIEMETVHTGINAYRQSYITQDSLYARSKIVKSKVMNSKPVRMVEVASIEKATDGFMTKLKETYSKEAVVKEILAFLEAGKTTSEDLPLETDRDFSRLMLASIIGMQSKPPYLVKFYERRVSTKQYEVPMIQFSKKGDVL